MASDLVPRRGEPDYMKYPDHPTVPSFHFRTGKPALLPVEDAPKQPANEFGFPVPGVQSPTPAHATAAHYFVDEEQWKAIVDHGEFDDIVCGSGFCALAYVSEALERNPRRKILILERGGFWLPEHFQNLPLPYKMVLGGPSETFPWQLSSRTFRSELKFLHGSCPFFGGRSTFWSAWCPQPSEELMRGFPQSMIDTANQSGFWEKGKRLLHVTPANEIQDEVFGALQNDIDARLSAHLHEIPSATSVEPGPLAVGKATPTSTLSFQKFSTPGPLLALQETQRQLAKRGKGSPLIIATDVVVEKFLTDSDNDNVVNVLKTSRGDLCFPNGTTNVVLATGAIPATTIALNSLESMQTRAGNRLTGHFITHVAARFPIDPKRYPQWGSKCDKGTACDGECKQKLEIGATYLAGMDEHERQYHVQITAIHSPHPEWDAVDAGRECPDYAAAATLAQLEGSEDYIVLICATLGELDENNKDSWVKPNRQDLDVTTNIKLQVTLDETATALWRVMDQATYDTIAVAAGDMENKIEYWHDDKSNPGWHSEKPSRTESHVPGVVHECSTLYMGPESDPQAAVGDDYALHGCKNVYVTGGAIFPSAGSWNPTLTMSCYAQDLARKLVPVPV
ncbi:FAD/NAD(P)-binding domain-containing protein [Exidia glandulosa HHB12029]|uniref:FAD/NAD(P)-binding domain-containing protein n=1 Tax=Exidia glandulosa HHB12029 TaxID=1314781 RepID=A0A165ECW8_EXIGL|nr:FAD/NAD(P)-binding domain-containing protein [Exidia glandulosa HHB12029]